MMCNCENCRTTNTRMELSDDRDGVNRSQKVQDNLSMVEGSFRPTRPAVSGYQEGLLKDYQEDKAMGLTNTNDFRPGRVAGINEAAGCGPVVKDSGKRQQFTSGMQRDTQEGKPRWDLAMDGPLLRYLYDDDPLVQAFFRWYDSGLLFDAAVVVELISEDDGGADVFLTSYSTLMAEGAIKYTERNWMQANGQAELARFRISACRHFWQWLFGHTDERHGAAVMFNLNGYHYVQDRLQQGDVGTTQPVRAL